MFKKVVPVIIVLGLFAACAGPKMNLREMSEKGFLLTYNPIINAAQKYHIVANSETAQEVMGQEQKFTFNREIILTEKATSADKNTIHYSITYDSLKMDSSMPMMTNFEDFKEKLLKATILLDTDHRGNVQNITGTEGLPPMPGGMTITEGLKNFFVVFPEKIIKVGDTWDEDKKMSVPSGPMTVNIQLKSQYKLLGVESFQGKDCLKIQVATKITMTGSGNQGGMDLVLDGSGSSDGEILIDYQAGALASLTSKQSTEGIVTLPAQGMNIPMTTTQSETMVRLLK